MTHPQQVRGPEMYFTFILIKICMGHINYSSYHKELYALARDFENMATVTLSQRVYYLFDCESWKHTRSQAKLNKRHTKLVELNLLNLFLTSSTIINERIM